MECTDIFWHKILFVAFLNVGFILVQFSNRNTSMVSDTVLAKNINTSYILYDKHVSSMSLPVTRTGTKRKDLFANESL